MPLRLEESETKVSKHLNQKLKKMVIKTNRVMNTKTKTITMTMRMM
jgi:hypothetical protein